MTYRRQYRRLNYPVFRTSPYEDVEKEADSTGPFTFVVQVQMSPFTFVAVIKNFSVQTGDCSVQTPVVQGYLAHKKQAPPPGPP